MKSSQTSLYIPHVFYEPYPTIQNAHRVCAQFTHSMEETYVRLYSPHLHCARISQDSRQHPSSTPVLHSHNTSEPARVQINLLSSAPNILLPHHILSFPYPPHPRQSTVHTWRTSHARNPPPHTVETCHPNPSCWYYRTLLFRRTDSITFASAITMHK